MKKWGLQSQHQSIQDKTCYRTDTHKECPKCNEIKTLDNFDKSIIAIKDVEEGCNNVVIYRNINFNSLADCKMLDKRTLRIGVEFRNYI